MKRMELVAVSTIFIYYMYIRLFLTYLTDCHWPIQLISAYKNVGTGGAHLVITEILKCQ